jgi:phage repressor protein C with HTH and peptisase S24 domain
VTQKLKNDDMMELIINAINNNQQAIFKVQGTSMEPFLKHNKTNVTLENYKKLNKGDIILFKYKNEYKLHRIIKIKGEHIIAKGDNAYQNEFLIDSDIIGVVVSYQTKDQIKNPKSLDLKILLFLWRLVKPLFIILRRIYGLFRK